MPEVLLRHHKADDPAKILTGLPLASLNMSRELARQFATATEKAHVVPVVRLQCDSLPQAFQAVQSGYHAAVLPTLAKPLAEASGIRVFGSKRFASMGRDMDLIWNPRVERVRPVIAGLAEEMEKVWRF